MDSSLSPSALPSFDKMSPRELAALVEDARSLQRAAEAGATQPLLKGRQVGLLCATGAGDDDLALFDSAVAELGAHVAHIRPDLTVLGDPQQVVQTAHTLGRLYDALVCQGLAPALVQRLITDAGIPICDGIASPDHPIAKAAATLGRATSAADSRRFLLQALLLKAVAERQ